MKIYTEQEIKSMCDPDIIKKMVELAEGFMIEPFEGVGDIIIYPYNHAFPVNKLNEHPVLFSSLIHRAVEGFNKSHHYQIQFFDDPVRVKFVDRNYRLSKYSKENLTELELALLHCLIEILKEAV